MFKRITFLLLISACTFIKAQADTSIVSLKSIDSTIVQDVRYATANNFTGKILYPSSKVFIREVVGNMLAKVNQYLKTNYGYRIKIFDAFRPLYVQKIMWAILPDDRFVANPAKGSRHNRGAAVDITLIDEQGNELDMGTAYDDFTEKAGYAYSDFNETVKANRKLLRETMIKFDFIPLDTEWWHFDYKDWKSYSLCDFSIE